MPTTPPRPRPPSCPALTYRPHAPPFRPSAPCFPISGRRGIAARGSGWSRRALPGLGQGRDRVRADRLWPGGRRAGAQGEAAAIIAVPVALIVGYGLLRVVLLRLRRAAGRGVRRRPAAHRPQGRRANLRPSAPAVAALPPRPADGRAVAGAGARHDRHRIGAAALDVQHHPDADRDDAGRGILWAHVRLAVRARHLRRRRRPTWLSRSCSRIGGCASAAS